MSVEVKDIDGRWVAVAGSISNVYAPIGAIFPFGGSSAPSGYLFCDGSAVSRSDYSALFAVIGTSFGSGDGSTTFNVPDFRGKFAEGTPSDGTVGTSITAGLPNITGRTGAFLQNSSNNSGALSTVNAAQRVGFYNAANGTFVSVNFNAASSNSIYGNSTTVQPPAVCVNYIIKAKDVNLSVGTQTLADRVEALENNVTETWYDISSYFTVKYGSFSGLSESDYHLTVKFSNKDRVFLNFSSYGFYTNTPGTYLTANIETEASSELRSLINTVSPTLYNLFYVKHSGIYDNYKPVICGEPGTTDMSLMQASIVSNHTMSIETTTLLCRFSGSVYVATESGTHGGASFNVKQILTADP